MRNYKNIFFALLSMLVFACGKRGKSSLDSEQFTAYPAELSASEFVTWKKNEAHLLKQRNSGDIRLILSYQPAEWLALKSLGTGASAEAILAEASNYEELLYFTLRLQLNEAQTELLKFKSAGNEDYKKRVEYYSFKVQKDIALVTDNNDTLPCNISHFERAYNVTNYSDLMLGFSKEQLSKIAPDWKNLTIVFKDKIFSTGTTTFSFERKELSNTPKVKVS